jgi:protocatechuate 3,4-dioxygenase beta subunit
MGGFVGGAPVQLNMMPRGRTVITDAQGAFEFASLPAGQYRVFASPGQYAAGYLGMAYGGKRPNGQGSSDPGLTIDLADGQRFDKATIALPRGGVITGRITDDNGDPMARVQIYTMMAIPGSTRTQRMGMGASTDDLGRFRLYGMAPGDYVVVAEARGPTFVPPNAAPETEESKIGFLTTYYPGTPDEAAAQRVRARIGAETPPIEMRMTTGRLFTIAGIVTDSQGIAAPRMGGQLYKGTNSNNSTYGFSTDEQGRFQMRNVPPGNYRLVVRGNRQPAPPNGPPAEPGEMANMPLALNADLDGLVVITRPGATITGKVVYETGPPQLPSGMQSFQMRVNAMPGDPENGMGFITPQPALVAPDLSFTMKGLFGETLLRSSGPNTYLKSVSVGGQDVTDTPYEFKNGDQVTLTMTTRASTLEGSVADATGKPATEAAVLVFSDDKAAWRQTSPRTRRGSVDATGKYRVSGLLPGRYYIVALPRERLNIPGFVQDAGFFEQLTKDATTFVVGEDEQRQMDLRLSTGSGG